MNDGFTTTGFKDSNEFCLYLERLKQEQEFDTYIETIVWYAENVADVEIEEIARFLNKKIKDTIEYEAIKANMMKETDASLVSLF